jgi:hypothetical protein
MDHIAVAVVAVFFFVVAVVVEFDIEVAWVDSIELFVAIVDSAEFDINFLLVVVDGSCHIIHLRLDKPFEVAAVVFVFAVAYIFVLDHNAINSVDGEVFEQSEVSVLVDLKVD